jgi:cytochrome P450
MPGQQLSSGVTLHVEDEGRDLCEDGGVNLADVDLTDYDRYVEAVPFEMFDLLRREAPVYWHEERPPNHGFWAITKYQDLVRVHLDWETFSSEVGAVSIEELDPKQVEVRKSLIDMDPPRHTELRGTFNRRFTPRAVAEYEGEMRSMTGEILTAALAKGEFDFAEEVATQLPIRFLCRLLAIPEKDGEQLTRWGDALFGNTDPEYSEAVVDSEDTEAYRLLPFRSPAGAAMFDYAEGLARERRQRPGSDLVTTLMLEARIDRQPLSDREFKNNFQLLVAAGNETTRHAISHGMLALMSHPDQMRRLVDDPSLMPVAVEEILRWATPIYQFRRTATRDSELRGRRIRRGEKVVAWYISANRDEDAFPDPYRFDVTRRPNEHVTYGPGGPHYCLGAHLARLELRVLFEELLPRIRHAESAGPVQRLRSNFINGIKHMPVRIEPV